MNRGFVAILGAMLLSGATVQAQNYHSPKDFFNISPQVGGTTAPKGELFAGVIASQYWRTSDASYIGAGAGAYVQGDEPVGEILLKGSILGIFGISVGPSFSESGGVSLTNDLWANAVFAGLRWRMDHRSEKTIHSVALFVPLGLWMQM